MPDGKLMEGNSHPSPLPPLTPPETPSPIPPETTSPPPPSYSGGSGGY